MKIDREFLRMRVVAWYENTRPARQRIIHFFQSAWANRRRGLRYGLYAGGGGILLLGLLVVLVYYGAFGKMPTYGELKSIQNNTASEVYGSDEVLLGRYFVENRVNADFDEIPIHLVNALVATEDARFFEHSGVDARALARVAVKTVLLADRSSGGGSTISQQLAKNLYQRRSYGPLTIPVNKLREMFVARRLERVYAKEELLRLYLNTVPFGENMFGIKVASQRFFNKSAADLTVEEAAVLVGMLKANTYYNPLNHPERAKGRRDVVLKQMMRYEYLDSAQVDSLTALPLTVDQAEVGYDDGLATYFRAHLRQELEAILADHPRPDGTPYNLYTDGLRIYTTIDSRMQQYAEKAVRDQMKRIQAAFEQDWGYSKRNPWGSDETLMRAVRNSQRYQRLEKRGYNEEEILATFEEPRAMTVFQWEADSMATRMTPMDSVKHYLTLLNAGFLAVEPQTGLVKAWVGGIDHQYVQYDHVKAQRPVGSTFKPLVYTLALEKGFDPCMYIQNERKVYEQYEDWSPRNSDGNYEGYYTMEGALSHSVNTITVELLLQAGVDSVRTLARKMGLAGPLPTGPAIGLGAVDGSLLELSTMYSTFANGGVRPVLHYLDRIENADGEVIVSFNRPDPRRFERVIRPETNAVMVKMLQSVVDSGTARRLRYEFGLYNQLAGKTGTTQNQSDGWFMGVTPSLVVGAWVGAESPQVHFRSMRVGQGSSTALPIAGQFMQQLYRDKSFRSWRNGQFPPLPDSVAYTLDCPPYLEDPPVAENLWDLYEENPDFFNRLFLELRDNNKYFGADLELRRRRNNESDEEYFWRMLEYNERVQRRAENTLREELKYFWSEKLFGGNKSEDKKNEGGN